VNGPSFLSVFRITSYIPLYTPIEDAASLVLITSNGNIEVDMSHFDKEGGLDNYFMANFDVINMAQDEKLAITKITSQYEGSDGKWIDAPIQTGSRIGYWNYNWGREPRFNMDPLAQTQIAINTLITIKGPHWERERRCHKSLPQPLKIKITFEDAKTRTCSIVVEYNNEPRQLIDRAQVEKNDKKKADFWIQCDDVNFEARLYSVAFLNDKDKRIEFRCNSSSTPFLYKKNFKKLVYKANQSNQSEVPIEGGNFKSNGCTAAITCLVDLQHNKAYALKFFIQTTTGSAIGYYKIPQLK